jgi:hypothetical protein
VTSALSVDVENEFQDLLEEATLLARAVDQMAAATASADEALVWVLIAGLAAGCEKIYSGCERVMGLLATRLDGEAVVKTDSWHAVLLNRMAHPFPGVRDAIISGECRVALDRFRAFRHRVRSNYGLHLDPDIVLERARELGPTLDAFHRQGAAFLAARIDPS